MCANFQPPPLETLLAWGFDIAEGTQYKPEVYPGQVAPILKSSDPNRIHLACFGQVTPPHNANQSQVVQSSISLFRPASASASFFTIGPTLRCV